MSEKNVGKRPRKVTLDMILASTTLTRSSTESSDAYLKRVTHLHLQGKRIKVIEGLDQCANLKVLYLYDNQIERIENLEFAVSLQYLQLQNNLITEVPDLQMQNLTKIYLCENSISFVCGLESCNKLEELLISNQNLPSYTSLQFDPSSMAAIARTLQVLDVSGNGISSLELFCGLRNLRKLLCGNNSITEISEIESVIGLRHLAEADFAGNPCSTQHKYRDHVIAASSDSLRILDETPVLRHQQIAIRGLAAHRRKLLGPAFPVMEEGNSVGDESQFGLGEDHDRLS